MKHLFKALAEFQQEVPVIHKGTQGYGYTYTDLPKIFEVINPLLKKHGLGFTQLLDHQDGRQILKTCVFHVESGESIESSAYIPQIHIAKMNDYQSLGSGITYFRRYSISTILNIVTDKDLDAAGKQVYPEPKQEPIKEETPTKKRLDAKRFQEAIKVILDEEQEFTKDMLIEKFDLTEHQLKALEEL